MENEKKDSALIRSSAAEYLTFVASTGEDKDSIEMRYEDENIWLTQKMMATLYDVGLPTINEHIKKIYADHEQDEAATIRKFRIVQNEGGRQVTRSVNHYNLQMIIAVGFKVNNQRAVRFRVWANQIVEQYTIKGWAMDEERLKNGGTVLTKKYFEEQLERIREIRISERNFYQKLTDIYATSLDYDRNALTTKEFFAKVQNKMHYAVHRHTAAELIYERADAEKPHMGLHTWKDAPNGKIKKSDVSVAKNYLTEDEMKSMELIVSAYLDLAENRARRHIPMTMEDWAKRLDIYLQADDLEVLKELNLITLKPVLYVLNMAEDDIADPLANKFVQAASAEAEKEGAKWVPISAEIEEEVSELDGEEAKAFLEDLGEEEPGLNRLIRTAYSMLGLINFFTVGPDECRSWTVRAGTKAPKAAGKIHSDIERGFIRAEIVSYDDLMACGSYNAVREKGLLRVEGKDYIIQDGDIAYFRFNV